MVTQVLQLYCFLESGVEDGVEDVARVIRGPELAEDGCPDWSDVDSREEVAEETTQLLVELAPGTDGVTLPVQIQSHVLWKMGEKYVLPGRFRNAKHLSYDVIDVI